jgi:hypothetical protein
MYVVYMKEMLSGFASIITLPIDDDICMHRFRWLDLDINNA